MVKKKDLDEIIIYEGLKLLTETYRDTQTDGPWYKIGDSDGAKDLSNESRKLLLQNSRDKYFMTPEGRSLVRSTAFYVIGKGIVYRADDENPVVQRELDAFWNNPKNIMELRQKEIIIRVLRDGEAFIRYFDVNGQTVVRFVEPEQIMDIEYDPNDAETPIAYKREWLPQGETQIKKESIPAKEVTHIKPTVDMNMKRGRPLLEPIIKRLVELEQFIEGRVRKNRLAAGLILEKIIHGKGGTSSAVSSIVDGMSDASVDAGIEKASKKMPKFGSVVVHNDAIEYKWCNPEIKADDCKEDARLLKLSICAGINAPEYILSDASNANFASTMVAENPYVRMCEDLQDTFAEYFKIIFRIVIERAIANGRLPSVSKETVIKEHRGILGRFRVIIFGEQEVQMNIPTKTSVTIEFPPMIHKDIKMESEALQIHTSMGWASDRTVASKLGYDYDAEKELRKAEAQERGEADKEEDEFQKARDEEAKNDVQGAQE